MRSYQACNFLAIPQYEVRTIIWIQDDRSIARTLHVDVPLPHFLLLSNDVPVLVMTELNMS